MQGEENTTNVRGGGTEWGEKRDLLHQTLFQGLGNSTSPGVHVKFRIDVAGMSENRGRTKIQPLRNFFPRETIDHQGQDLSLPVRQVVPLAGRPLP